MTGLGEILPIVLIVLVFYLLVLRPQRRRQQALVSTQSALAVGTEVMLGSGIFGTVAALDDETLQLELSPGTTVKVSRQAVVRVIEPGSIGGEQSSDLDDSTPHDRIEPGDETPGPGNQHQ